MNILYKHLSVLSGIFLSSLLQAQPVCNCKVVTPNAYQAEIISMSNLENDTVVVFYSLPLSGMLTQITCNGAGQQLDSASFAINGRAIFNDKAEVFVAQTDTSYFSITRFDRWGDTIASHLYPALIPSHNTYVRDVKELDTGEFLVTGVVAGSTTRGFLLKIAASGIMLWHQVYFYGTAFEKVYPSSNTPGACFLAGTTQSYYNAAIASVDSMGAMIWNQQVGGLVCTVKGLVELSDGSIILSRRVTGLTGPSINCYLEKYDSNGNLMLSNPMEQYAHDNLTIILDTTEGLVTDGPDSYVFYFTRITYNDEKRLVFVRVNGNMESLCTKTYSRQIKTFNKTATGKYSAIFYSFDSFDLTNALDICGQDPCDDLSTPAFYPENRSSGIVLSPNPSLGKLNVQWDDTEGAFLSIYNLCGIEVFSQTISPGIHTLDLQAIPSGQYIVCLKRKDGFRIAQSKLILQ